MIRTGSLLEVELHDLHLNARKKAESTRDELECIWDDPERDERPNKVDEAAGKREPNWVDLIFLAVEIPT